MLDDLKAAQARLSAAQQTVIELQPFLKGNQAVPGDTWIALGDVVMAFSRLHNLLVRDVDLHLAAYRTSASR